MTSLLLFGLHPCHAQTAVPAGGEYQVLIDMLIFEVQYENYKDLGLQWDYFETGSEFALGDIVGAGGADWLLNSSRIALPIDEAIIQSEGMGGLAVALVHEDYGALKLTLQALARSKKAKLLSQPRILTQLGSTASIRTQEKIPYLIKQAAGNNVFYVFAFADAGLDVEVGVGQDYDPEEGSITLMLYPRVQVHTRDIDYENLELPVIETREAFVTLKIPSGRIFIIGGLFRDVEDESWQGVPILGDIPLLGYLFRNKHTRKIRSELVIFVTPRIIRFDEKYTTSIQSPSRFGEWKKQSGPIEGP